jgi:hypothetical protein
MSCTQLSMVKHYSKEVTGDTFTPAPLTTEIVRMIDQLAGAADLTPVPLQQPLLDPSPPYALDPLRGVTETPLPSPADTPADAPPAPTGPTGTIVQADSSEATYELADLHQADQAVLADFPADLSEVAAGQLFLEGEPELQPGHFPDSTSMADIVEPADVAEFSNRIDEPSDEVLEAEFQGADAQVQEDSEEINIAEQLTAVRQTQRYNLRSSTAEKHVYSVLSYKEAEVIYGPEAVREAGFNELRNCIDKGVWECLPPSSRLVKPIPSKLFLTPKTSPSGEFKLLKGRIVGGGHRQDHAMFTDSEISSPTVSLTSVMIGAAVAAHEQQHVMTLDHKAAYLNAAMKGPEVIMLLTPDVSSLLIELDSSYTQYLRPDRKIAVRLKKALYGCIQSAVLWYNELSSTIESMGFKKNPYDMCSFMRTTLDDVCTILVYVDDLFIMFGNKTSLTEVADMLKKKYGGITTTEGRVHDYLGIRWDFTVPRQVTLSMEGYVKDLLLKYGPYPSATTPGAHDLFVINESPPIGREKREMFHSAVMTLHYLAKRVRPDILAAVSFCATRVLAPTDQDYAKLKRILGYLSITLEQKLLLRIGAKLEVRAYVDSSFGTYMDCKSVTGTVIYLGEAPVYFKSSKQKVVTRSSTEAELIGISDALSQILWMREYVLHQKITVGPVILFQDNKSTIFLASKGRSTSERTRHIKIRYFFISHYIETNEIIIKHMPTASMIADALTKPLHGATFVEMTKALTGYPHKFEQA